MALILISILVVLGYFVWPFWVLFLLCVLLAGPLFWGTRLIAKVSARFIKRLYPMANEDSWEVYICVSIMLLAWPASLVLIFILFV